MIPSISLNVIVKNGGRDIARMLSSVKNLVKEIIVVDTGSTDNTIQICNDFNIKVINNPVDNWTGVECVKSRQLALESSNMPWVLVMDDDEELGVLLIDEMRTFIHQNKFDCLNIRRVNFRDNQESYYDTVSRLFRNNIGYRWFTENGHKHYSHEYISLSSNGLDTGKSCTSINEMYHFGWLYLTDNKLSEKMKRYSNVGYYPIC